MVGSPAVRAASRRTAPSPRRRGRARRAVAPLHAVLALAGALVAAASGAQPRGDLNDLARTWTFGEWATPLVCELGGEPRRGLRRIVAGPAPRDNVPRANKLVFEPLQLPAGTRCILDTGETQPEVAGAVFYHLEGHSRPDIADHDFQEALERDGGFTFKVTKGALHVDGRRVDFAGGRLRFERARPGTDAWRRLRDLPSPQKLVLTLEAKDGTRLAFDLARTPPPKN